MRWRRRWRRVVRARRIEVVDERGRPWLVCGSAPEAASTMGLWVLGPDGSPRVWLGVDGAGAALAVGRDGTVVAGLGTNDPGPGAAHVGAYAFVSEPSGRPV